MKDETGSGGNVVQKPVRCHDECGFEGNGNCFSCESCWASANSKKNSLNWRERQFFLVRWHQGELEELFLVLELVLWHEE